MAALSNGRLSQKGTSLALRHLAEHGIVLVEDHPPSKLYTLNEQHLATSGIRALAGMRSQLIAQLKDRLCRWEYPPSGAWLFGSVARGDGGVASDIDLFVIRPDTADGGDQWDAQVDELTEAVRSWTGNPCSIVDLSEAEFRAAFGHFSAAAGAKEVLAPKECCCDAERSSATEIVPIRCSLGPRAVDAATAGFGLARWG